MEFLSNLEREEFLAEIATSSFNPKKQTKKKEMEIEVDPNFQYTEEQLRAYELAKNDAAWKRYFNS